MAFLQAPVGAGYRETQRDLLLLVYMMNLYLVRQRQTQLLSVQTRYGGKLWDAIADFQKREGIAEKPGLVTNGSKTFARLHQRIRETTGADKDWETGSSDLLREKIREQHRMAEITRNDQRRSKAEQEEAEAIKTAIERAGGLATFIDACTRAGVSFKFAFTMITKLSQALPLHTFAAKVGWWAKFFRSVSFDRLLCLLRAPINFGTVTQTLKSLKGFGGVAAAFLVFINAGYYIWQGEYSAGITEIMALLYSLVVWPAALGDLFETLLPAYIKNTTFWRWIRLLNPARHARILVRCGICVVQVGLCAIAGNKGGVNAAANELLKWMDSDDCIVELNKFKGSPIDYMIEKFIASAQLARDLVVALLELLRTQVFAHNRQQPAYALA